MRIVFDVEGDNVMVSGPNGPAGGLPEFPPGDPPRELLERAKKLGAMSAGAARVGPDARLAAVAEKGEALRLPGTARSKKAPTKPKRRRT